MESAVHVLPLAEKPLRCPHPYYPHYQVEVQLDEPLWVPRVGSKDVAMTIMGYCVLMESVAWNGGQSWESSDDHMTSGDTSLGKRVTFDPGQGTYMRTKQLIGYEAQMEETLIRNGQTKEVFYEQDCLKLTGLDSLFPRAAKFMQGPDLRPYKTLPPSVASFLEAHRQQQLHATPSPIMDGYFAHLSSLNNILMMSQQLNSDLRTCASHKYIAHQTALLYQCLGQVPQFARYKKDIEAQFSSIKALCAASAPDQLPRLSPELQQWLGEVTQRFIEMATSLSADLTAPLGHVTRTIHSLPL